MPSNLKRACGEVRRNFSFNFNLYANSDDGSCIPVVIGCTDATALNYDSIANVNNGCVYPILGCTNPTQFNYDPLANTDDGSCVPYIYGCTDSTATNFNSLANTNVGCIYPIFGCTDPNAFNFNINANTDDGSCVPVIIGCTDATALNFDSLANTNVGCIYPILGCTDPTMFNYDPTANVDDGSCTFPVQGCTDDKANNYDPLAVIDNGSCTFDPTYNCDYVSPTGGIITVYDGTGTYSDPVVAASNCPTCNGTPGCTDSNFVEYDPLALCDDGSCVTLSISGCTDSTIGAPFFPDIHLLVDEVNGDMQVAALQATSIVLQLRKT